MSTIVLEVPDELAMELTSVRDQLPALLSTALEFQMSRRKTRSLHGLDLDTPVFSEVIDFLASSPSPEKIVDFKISSTAQTRLSDLLYKNREASLTPAEEAELDVFEQVEHIMILLKARARASLRSVN